MNRANNHCILAIKKDELFTWCTHHTRVYLTYNIICKPANNLQIINPSSTPHFIQKKKQKTLIQKKHKYFKLTPIVWVEWKLQRHYMNIFPILNKNITSIVHRRGKKQLHNKNSGRRYAFVWVMGTFFFNFIKNNFQDEHLN